MSRHVLPTLLAFLCCSVLRADEPPLSSEIDRLLSAHAVGPVAAQTDDATLLKRLSLDLLGRIPTEAELRAYLADESPNKREATIDRMLASDEFTRHMAVVLDVMLMERRGGTHVKSDQFRDYLQTALEQQRSYLTIATEILAADGAEASTRPAAAFYLERGVEPHVLTRDVGRVFFGIDLQCAQCHDHPNIADYLQLDYYGLNAFFVRSSLFQKGKKEPAVIAELATGEADFKSVFTEETGLLRPRMPGGDELHEITLKPGSEYKIAPAKNVRPVPIDSRLVKLSKALAEAPTEAFDRNIANRFWAMMFGRGLVHPVDLHHSDNPPIDPELLSLIANEFAAHDYDVRWLLREFARTKGYSRSSRRTKVTPSAGELRQRVATLSKERESRRDEWNAAEQRLTEQLEALQELNTKTEPLRGQESKATKAYADAQKNTDAAVKATEAQAKKVVDVTAPLTLLREAVGKAEAVTKAFPKDAELATALKTLTTKRDAQQQMVTAETKKLEATKSALDAKRQALTKATEQADEAIRLRAEGEQSLIEQRRVIETTRETVQRLRTTLARTERDLKYAEKLLAITERDSTIAKLRTELVGISGSLTAGEQAVADSQSKLVSLTKVMAQTERIHTAKERELAAHRKTWESAKQRSEHLIAALTNAELVAKETTEDAQLAEAVTLLKGARDRLETETGKLAKHVEQHTAAVQQAMKEAKAARSTMEAETKRLGMLKQQQTELANRRVSLQTQLENTIAEREGIAEEVLIGAEQRFHITGLTALSPEQFARSLLVATGQYDRLHRAETAKWDKQNPLPEGTTRDDAAAGEREDAITSATEAVVRPIEQRFAKLYGAGAGQPQTDFFATAEQSLFVANGNEVRSWLAPAAGNLTDRVLKLDDPDAVAEMLYLSILTRRPTAEEAADVRSHLQRAGEDRTAAVQEIGWALLSSAEFRFRR